MKLVYTSILAIFSTAAIADITVKPDGTVICTGRCDGVITQGPGGTFTSCQGGNCVTISLGGVGGGGHGGTKFPEKRPGDEK